MTVSLATARTNVLTVLGDSTNTIWSNTEVDAYLQEGYNRFLRATLSLWQKATPSGLQDVANTATYTLPTDLIEVDRISYDGRRLIPMRSEQLTRVDYAAYTESGYVVGYVLDGDGYSTLRKYRIPAATDSSSKTSIEYFYLPTFPTSGQDFSAVIPDPWVKYFEWYSTSRALRRNGDGQDIRFADHFLKRFLDAIQRIVKQKSRYLSTRVGRLGPTTRLMLPLGPKLPWNYPRGA